jgi:hypothetical protein
MIRSNEGTIERIKANGEKAEGKGRPDTRVTGFVGRKGYTKRRKK